MGKIGSSVSLAAVLVLGCTSSPKKEDRSVTVHGNYCTEMFGSHAVAQVYPVMKFGVTLNEFFCVIEERDSNNKQFEDLQNLMAKRSLLKGQKKSEGYDLLTNEAKQSLRNYLKEKCPQGWSASLLLVPLGWKCESDRFPMNKACLSGEPRVETLPSNIKTIFCVDSEGKK